MLILYISPFKRIGLELLPAIKIYQVLLMVEVSRQTTLVSMVFCLVAGLLPTTVSNIFRKWHHLKYCAFAKNNSCTCFKKNNALGNSKIVLLPQKRNNSGEQLSISLHETFNLIIKFITLT
jgi:hypothetical protein